MAKKKNKYEGFRRLTLFFCWVGFLIILFYSYLGISEAREPVVRDYFISPVFFGAIFYFMYKGINYVLKGFME